MTGRLIAAMPKVNQKDLILSAAMQTVHERGFNGCGIQEIAQAAGVPKGSVYNYFESKEALGLAALNRYFEERTCERLQVLRQAGLRPIERLRRYFEALAAGLEARGFAGGCMIGNLSAELSDQSGPVRDRLAALLADWTGVIAGCVRDAQDAGELRADLPAETVAGFLLNAWEGAILRARVERSAAPFDAFRTVVFTVLRGEEE